MEFVRRETRLVNAFARDDIANALAAFRQHYNITPDRGICAPDVFARIAELFERSAGAAHQHSTRLALEGVPIVVGIVEPGTIAFEGNVDETKMGDW